MEKDMLALESRKIAANYQEKTLFYIVGLIFTTLAFSIQTATFDGSTLSKICELLAWLSFIISGLFGIAHLIGIPAVYGLYADRIDLIHNIPKVEQEKNDVDLKRVQEKINKSTKQLYCFMIMVILFGIFGLMNLLISRGIDPLRNIF